MEIRLKSTCLELLFLCLCLRTGKILGQGATVVNVTEGCDAVLPCSIPGQDITQNMFDWRKVVQKDDNQEVFEFRNGKQDTSRQDEQFKGRVSHFPDQLKSGNASIRINNTNLSDSGTYSCDYSPDKPNRQTFYIDLVVDCIIKDRSKEKLGASQKPCVTTLDRTRDEAQLQCEVNGVFPKPKVEWKDSSGNILHAEKPQVTEREGRYDIILQTTVTETGNYSCVVTQGDICHQISAETSFDVYESPTGWIVGVVVLSIILGVVVAAEAVLYKMGCIKLNCKKGGSVI